MTYGVESCPPHIKDRVFPIDLGSLKRLVKAWCLWAKPFTMSIVDSVVVVALIVVSGPFAVEACSTARFQPRDRLVSSLLPRCLAPYRTGPPTYHACEALAFLAPCPTFVVF